jgi:hypothetical protein
LKVKSLLLSASWLWLRLQYCETAARRRCVFLLACNFVLFEGFYFLFYIGGCSDLGHFAFDLVSATALGWRLRSRIIKVALVHVNLWTVYFAAVDLRVL